MKRYSALLLGLVVVGGCASYSPTEYEAKEERVYVTGSNLPRKGDAKVYSKEAIEPLQRSTSVSMPSSKSH